MNLSNNEKKTMLALKYGDDINILVQLIYHDSVWVHYDMIYPTYMKDIFATSGTLDPEGTRGALRKATVMICKSFLGMPFFYQQTISIDNEAVKTGEIPICVVEAMMKRKQ